MTLGWRASSHNASPGGRRERAASVAAPSEPRLSPASSSTRRSRLRRSIPWGGGAAGRVRTGATHQWSPSSRRQPIQRLCWMMGAPHWRSVRSRLRRRSCGAGLASPLNRGTASESAEISQRVTRRPLSAKPACRSTSRRSCTLTRLSSPPGIAPQHRQERAALVRAFLRHRRVLLRRLCQLIRWQASVADLRRGAYACHLLMVPPASHDFTRTARTARAARVGLVVLTLINLFNYLDRWIVAALAESM